MTPHFSKIHLRFKLNGIYFDRDALKEVAYSFIKEGEPYEMAVGNFLTDWLNDKETIRIKTSGTTGDPKMISIKKQYMVNSAIATGNFFKTEIGDSALSCLSANYIAGKMMLVRAMILGLELDLAPPSSRPLGHSNKQYDFCAMVPLQVLHSIDQLDRVGTLIIGGAPITNTLFQKLQLVSANAFATYGMTETITHIAAKKLNNFASASEVRHMHYQLLPDVSISQDERNCLVINASKLNDETIITNDIVKIIDENTFEWLGRYDNVINSGGVKLIPEQIELKLAESLPRDFFVSSLPDETLGEKLVLVIEGDTIDIDPVTYANLDTYETPKETFFIPEFERTGSGKIKRSTTLETLL
ncbi:AMP-binding protein [Spongiivirga citrea]|uniref:AMP-binding protein n=1 Tax=Spongiivirga citrea TaxID=1481457 RepID=A0A6M0CF53_9FLAO|nr:AMP-binding protein [Spongiivirga citrea]NER16478.1 AMP-binding protein [Spongiivirga citrea]